MNTTQTTRRLLICAALAALSTVASAAAAAAINRCIDQDGQVLLTDEPCPATSRVVNLDVSDDGSKGVVINSGGIEHVAHGAQPSSPAPRSRWADLPRPLQRKVVGLDASTLQTARMNLQIQDELRRQHRLASR